jgi:small-conductance mechanosensitive channel
MEIEMLKFEKAVKIGDRIRAYDFEPIIGRTAYFIEGTVFDISMLNGVKFFFVKCDFDMDDDQRRGMTIWVPMEMMFDYDNRITVL